MKDGYKTGLGLFDCGLQVIHLVNPGKESTKNSLFFFFKCCFTALYQGLRKKSQYAIEKVNRIWVTCKLLIIVIEILISVKFIQEVYITSCCLLTALAKQSLPTIYGSSGLHI